MTGKFINMLCSLVFPIPSVMTGLLFTASIFSLALFLIMHVLLALVSLNGIEMSLVSYILLFSAGSGS